MVVGFVETHGRKLTEDQIGDLEVVGRRKIRYRDAEFEEMDVDEVLARRPSQAVVDELAHSNIPGSKNAKRWQDVEELLDAGIDVISTVNIQHLESVNDVVERITGVVQRETVPDSVVRAADQIELVDMSPEALRRRMAHGNIYVPEKVDAALANYFRLGNLAALRELALLWVADRVEDSLQQYMEDHGITRPWETRERVRGGRHGSTRGRDPHPAGVAYGQTGEGRSGRGPRPHPHRPRRSRLRRSGAAQGAPEGARWRLSRGGGVGSDGRAVELRSRRARHSTGPRVTVSDRDGPTCPLGR